MLTLFPDHKATLILRAIASGQWQASGQTDAKVGYTTGDPNSTSADGVWAQWSWQNNQLTVTNDRFGFLPVYYAAIGDGFGVSTSALELINAGADTTLDDRGIAVFLRLGYYVGDDTPFQAIRVLPPGSRLTWTNNKLQIESIAPALPQQVSTLSREQAVREYGERFQNVVEQMLPDADAKMCVPLSAGRDSRHILYALLRAGRRPDMVVTARSAPPRPDTDAKTAAGITKALGLPHTIIEQSQDRFDDEMNKDVLTSFCADEHFQMVPVSRWMQAGQYKVSWDGIAGDIFSCGVYSDNTMLDRFRNRQFAELSSWMLDTEGYLPHLLTPEYQARWHRDLAIQRVSEELEKYADLPNPAAPFFFFNRVRRELALCPYGMLNQSTHILAPYLSPDIFDLLIDLPFEFFKGREFHSEAIDQFYPEMPKFEYVSTPKGATRENRSKICRFAGRLGSLVLSTPEQQSCVQRRFLLPRLAKAMISRQYGTEFPVLFKSILVVLHLEDMLLTKTCT